MTILDALLVVIIDQPGREREALRSMLASMQNVRIVEILDDCSEFDGWMEGHFADLVVIRKRPDHATACTEPLKAIKTANPRAHLLVIVEKIDQVQALEEGGMDHVFLTGFTSNELFAVLDQWSMDKILNYFTEEQKVHVMKGHSSYLEMLI